MTTLDINKYKINKILIFSLPGIGDTLLFTPALRVLRRNYPTATIDTLVMFQGSGDVLKLNPFLDKVLVWDFLNKGYFKSLKFVLKIRKKYDLVVTAYPANRLEYNWINFMLAAKLRPTHKYNHLDFICGGFLNHQVIKESDHRHNALENLYLLRNIGLDIEPVPEHLEVFLDDSHRTFGEKYFSERGLNDSTVIGFHPGCATLKNHENRRWAPEKFSELGTVLKSKLGVEILVFGGPDELELKSFVASNMKPPGIVVEKTNMLETAALMERCKLFISNISSLMHLSSALRTPTVALFGPTSHIYERPYGTPYRVVRKGLKCSPCFFYSPKPLSCREKKGFECMKTLTVNEVKEACFDLLKEIDE